MPAMLSPHFSETELFGSHVPNDTQRWLASRLCNDLLEPIRRVIGSPLYVSDGFRSWDRVLDLRSRGYKPSPTSDHAFLEAWNPYGVGAADLLKLARTRTGHTRREGFTREDFDLIVRELCIDESVPPWGQFIYYTKRKHVHVSNRRELYFSRAFVAAHGFAMRRSTYVNEET